MDNFHNQKKNTNNIEKNPSAPKTAVKTIYLDASGNMSRASSFLGIVFLFFCIFIVCIGLIMCVSESFRLEVSMPNMILTLTVSILFFTLIYFLPSKLFTASAFLLGAGGFAVYAIFNYNYIIDAAYYTLNLCLYRINQEGYIIGSIVDYDLAKTANDATAAYINFTAVLVGILFAAIFSYLVYSKKNIIYSLLFSVAVVFPGFFYGLIPSYFSFSLVAAFWVSQFSINIFESSHMAYVIGRENSLPEKRLAKYKLKMFKMQYRQNIKSIKSEIVKIVKSPNRNENSIRLDRLIRQLKSVSHGNKLFFMFYGLSDPKNTKQSRQSRQNNPKRKTVKPNNANINNIANIVNIDDVGQIKALKNKEKFISPVKIEKQRLAIEAKEKKAADKLVRQTEKKEFAQKPFSERMKIRFGDNIKAKKKYSIKSGYAGIFALVVAFAAVTVVQPFISPKAKFNLSMPEQIMNFLTTTIEYTLVGSDSSVYGGYNGGMGGGFLYRPGGAKFKDKAILKVSGTTRSSVIYLKGWTGTIYTGNMWQEADKKQIEEYNKLTKSNLIPRFSYIPERSFFKTFSESMQNIFNASYQRRGAELKRDKIKIEHLVSGGKRSFLPYFFDDETIDGGMFNFKANSDLSVEITNSLFKYPIYTTDFYSIDNVLNRAGPVAVDDMKEYLHYYNSRMDTSLDLQKFLSLVNPPELKQVMPDAQFFSRQQFTSMSSRRFDTLVDEGTFYEYSAPSPDYSDQPEYHGYIHIPYKYDEIIDIVRIRYNIYNTDGTGSFISSDFVDSEVLYNKFVREHYLQLTDNFPQEVIDLAEEITMGLSSDYEKALAIEKYLAQNHTYTLNPLIPIDTRADFVYNFLFDTKEGYCTAYASSMVMMLRSIGVPARYSEGYLVDTSKKQRAEDGRDYITVYDYNGHAWPEVYFRGIGWLPFEPTVSYNEDETEIEPYSYTPPSRIPGPDASMLLMEELEDDEDDDEGAGGHAPSGLPVAFYFVLIILMFCGFIFILNRLIISSRFKHFKSANTNTAVIKMLAYILVFLKHCGFVMHNDEGLKEFSQRISPNFLMINSDGWNLIAEVMQKARYSRHDISEDERAVVYDLVETLRKECLKKLKFNLKFKLQFVYFIL